jgi:hypothetical protein
MPTSLLIKSNMLSEFSSNQINVGILFNDFKPLAEYNELLLNNLSSQGITHVNLYSADLNFLDLKNSLKVYTIFRNLHALLHYALAWRNKNKTLSYKFRAISLFGSNTQRERIDNDLGFIPKSPQPPFKRYLVRLFSLVPLIFLLKKILLYLAFPLMANKDLNDITRFDLILIPYGARISIEEDFLIWYAKQKRIKTIAIQENWDNLSTKKFIFSQTDFFITWGEQSSNHLKQIQNYKGETKALGCIRMQQFYDYKNTVGKNIDIANSHKSTLKLDDELILFIGTGSSNDYDLLSALIEFLKEDPQPNDKRKYIFRPHPLSRNNLKNDSYNFKHHQLRIEFPKVNESNFYRIELMKQASLVVGFYSTVLLESLIMGKIVAIPSFIGAKNKYKSKNYLYDSAHFSGIKNLKNLYNLESVEGFASFLRNTPVKVEDANSTQILNSVCANKNTVLEITSLLKNVALSN